MRDARHVRRIREGTSGKGWRGGGRGLPMRPGAGLRRSTVPTEAGGVAVGPSAEREGDTPDRAHDGGHETLTGPELAARVFRHAAPESRAAREMLRRLVKSG